MIEQMDSGVEEISDVGEEFREFFGFSPNDHTIGTPGDLCAGYKAAMWEC